MPRCLSAALLLAVFMMPSHPTSAAASCPYKDQMRPIIATVSGYVVDATAMTPGQAESRALLIRLRLARVTLFFRGAPDSATLEGLLLAAVTDVETAVRTWYHYRDPDISNYWLSLAWRDLHRARQVFKRMRCRQV